MVSSRAPFSAEIPDRPLPPNPMSNVDGSIRIPRGGIAQSTTKDGS